MHKQTQDYFLDNVRINMQATQWFDADMCAAFGAILYRLGENLNTINLSDIPDGVEQVLSRNGFLSHYGREKLPDQWGTTIPYRRFDVKDDRYFADYIEKELVNRSEIPTMSQELMKKFRESIFEIFSNAVLHSRTDLGIFSCGQFFPKRNRIDFSVADLGVGMRKNIQEKRGVVLSAEKAINWATQENNTTKDGMIPGGLGLKLLCEFIDFNGGCIQIVSDAGHWQRKGRNTTITPLKHPFPGTIVTLEINTADQHSYQLTSKTDTTDIF